MFTCAAVGMATCFVHSSVSQAPERTYCFEKIPDGRGDGIQKQQRKCWEAVLFACSLSFIHTGMLVQLCQLSFSSGRKGVKNNAQ